MEQTNDLEQLLLTHFTTEDQQVFVKHFQDYLKYGADDTQFIVDFDDVYVWLGFTRKDHAKRLLQKKFNEGTDYTTTNLLPLKGEQDIPQHGGHNKEKCMLTVPTFKSFSMYCDTEKGKQTRQYYMKMEKVFFEYIQNNHKKVIEKMTKQAKVQQEQQRHDILIQAFKDTPCVYVANLHDDDSIVKIGECDDLSQRVKTLKTEYKVDNVTLLECFPCPNPRKFERFLLETHAVITPRRIGKTEFIKLDNILTLSVLVDILQKNLQFFAKNTDANDYKVMQNIIMSQERLNVYQKISEATNEEERKLWQDKLEELYDEARDIPSTSNSPPLPYRRVYKYDPQDLSNPVAEYISLTEASRSTNNTKVHDYHIREACVQNTICEGFRWFFVDNGQSKPNTIPETCNVTNKPIKRIGLLAQLNKEKNQIIYVYASQTEAAAHVKCAPCSLTVALSNNTTCAKSYWKMYEDCDETLKSTFEGQLPAEQNTKTCNKRVQQIDPKTKEVITTFESKQDVCSKLGICQKTITKYNASGNIYKGYIWKLVN
jgi:phage anti-repressor protein